jgi:hypothetical protein
MNRVDVSLATLNDDFNSPGSNVPHVAKLVNVVLGQEGKAEDYEALLDPRLFGVFQDTEHGDARAGSFIVWQRRQHLGPGRQTLIYAAPGRDDVMERYLACKRFKILDTDKTARTMRVVDVLLIAGHRDPKRREELWPIWDHSFLARVDQAHANGRQVIAGCDWNEHRPAVVQEAGLVWHSVGPREIDGFAATPGISFDQLTSLPKATADHHPITGVAHIPTRPWA